MCRNYCDSWRGSSGAAGIFAADRRVSNILKDLDAAVEQSTKRVSPRRLMLITVRLD